jgi:acetyl-CoA C-acetyltransferase
LHGVKPIDLVAALLDDMRTRVDPALIDDLILGCVTQTGEQGANLAKIAAVYAGWPDTVTGGTVNRFCASGLDAIGTAALRVQAGVDDAAVAGGVESMSRVPMFSDDGAWFADPAVAERTGFVHMGVAADLLATLEGLERADLDAYAARSHARAAAARDAGWFAPSIVPVAGVSHDELIRDGLTEDDLAALTPAFAETGGDDIALARYPAFTEVEHLHTIGTSPGMADAAAVAVIASEARAAELGLAPRARVLAMGCASVDPVLMLTGNVHAVTRALSAANLTTDDVDLFEVNESFAAVPLHFARFHHIDSERLNVCGGALSMGHPLGATGGILIATLVDELHRTGARIGVASICGGAGLATALVIERTS